MLQYGVLLNDWYHPESVRQVHNRHPGPPDDPGSWRPHQSSRRYGSSGFRYWITDEPNPLEHRCHCDWRRGLEHFSTGAYVDENGVRRLRDGRVERCRPLSAPHVRLF